MFDWERTPKNGPLASSAAAGGVKAHFLVAATAKLLS